MNKCFSVLQTTGSWCKWSLIRLGPVVSGVPEGIVLCTSLFSLNIIDIMSDIESEIRLFADDCVCYREIKERDDTFKLQKDIDRLGIGARTLGMRFQPVKCNMIQLTKKA